MRIQQWILLALIFLSTVSFANARTFPSAKNTATDQAELSQAMPEFASKVLAAYREDEVDKLLVNKMRLQMVAGNYRDADKSIHAVRQLRASKDDIEAATAYLVHECFSRPC